MPVPQLQMPNTAAIYLNQKIANQASMDRQAASANIAGAKEAKLGEDVRQATDEERLEAYSYAAKLLSSVQSKEDFAIAGQILSARYPVKGEGLKNMMGEYSPDKVQLLRRSLQTEAQKLKGEAEPGLKGFSPGTALYKGDKKVGSVPYKPTEPKAETKISLTMKALKGDAEARNILDELSNQAGVQAQKSSEGKIKGLMAAIDMDGVADSIIAGRETIENVKNTFGVPIQETVRKRVLDQEPNFNFVQPRAITASLRSSMLQQQKNRGMMGSFVRNINKQVGKLENISQDIVSRVGVRALDLPKREFLTRFVGSGHERVFEAYMKEVSAEIAKLAQGSAASIAQLPEENRKEWERIHDVNLSFGEIITILKGTREMANIRLQSVQDELDDTVGQMKDVRKGTRFNYNKAVNEMSDLELMEMLRGK